MAWRGVMAGREGCPAMTIYAPDDADLAALGMFGRNLDEAPIDPREQWRRTARPEQRLPDDDYRVFLIVGGRGSGKTRAGAQGLAEIILSDTEPGGQYGLVAPTFRDAWTVCCEGESGILRALGTSARRDQERHVKDRRIRAPFLR